MNRSRKQRIFLYSLDQRQVKAGFLNLFGSHSLLVVILAICTIITLNWFGEGLRHLLFAQGKKFVVHYSLDLHTWSIIGRMIWFPLLLIGWWLLIRRSFDSVENLIVRDQLGAPACKVLILFLSLPGKDKKIIRELISDSSTPGFAMPKLDELKTRFKGGWRMPLEAIHYHIQQDSLERIMVIPSATTHTVQGDIPGTYELYHDFRRLVERLFPVVSVHQAGEANPERWMRGVDFESARALRDCLADIFTFLRAESYREEDTLIDITSGQKVGSSVATLLSLQKGRQIQYVSTSNYMVKSYNIDYDA